MNTSSWTITRRITAGLGALLLMLVLISGLALLRTGDRVRIDLERCTANVLLPEAELAERRTALEAAGGYAYPRSQTPWQAIQRSLVGQLESGAILEGAEQFQRVAQTSGLPRDNH